jgi:hypothetical protein
MYLLEIRSHSYNFLVLHYSRSTIASLLIVSGSVILSLTTVTVHTNKSRLVYCLLDTFPFSLQVQGQHSIQFSMEQDPFKVVPIRNQLVS